MTSCRNVLEPEEIEASASMESQMVQNSRNKIGFTFNKFAIKVKRDFNQAQQNQFTFNRFPLKVKTFRLKLNKFPFKGKRYLSQAQEIT